ncbi:RNA polymerase II subunit A C-terminal domain phosphatase SSU72 isoform X1 [Fagus crenata]
MKFRYAMVCSSNQNRSMEAHSLLKRQAFDVSSYGTRAQVKLPGPSLREPNVYDFGTPYKQMFDDLRRKDPELYKRNGILPMLKRNSAVKLAPQRWQENAADGSFDVVFTFDEKVFDMVVEGCCARMRAKRVHYMTRTQQYGEPSYGNLRKPTWSLGPWTLLGVLTLEESKRAMEKKSVAFTCSSC